MSLMSRQLREVWDALRASHRHRDDALVEVRIRKLRGIEDLRVPFQYPVSVLAGANGCGKSTVLFACACAYRVPGRSPREFTPTSLFPDFTTQRAEHVSDPARRTDLEFHYVHGGDRVSMVWRRRKSWSRSYMGRKGGQQPEREVYLRTDLDGTASYSEFHMSSGERSVLRMSKDVSALSNALVLIDEVDTGLHPHTQRQTMLELQRGALRQGLQVVVASHSPVVIDSVPPEGRIFLDRDDASGKVRLIPAYRDIFQKALYGQSLDQLSILCEDAVAEGVIRGVLDVLNIELGLRHEDVVIGRNTGRDEFPGHVRALGKFGKLRDFIVVLDGDSRDLEGRIKAIAETFGQSAQPLFLPGNDPPEQWLWGVLRDRADDYADQLGLGVANMVGAMDELDRLVEGSVRRRDAGRAALAEFAATIHRDVAEIARMIGRTETRRNSMPELLTGLREQIGMWRKL